MAVQIVSGIDPKCEEGEHVDVVVRPRWDVDVVRLNMSCSSCGLVFAPSPSMTGPTAAWLMQQVEAARRAPTAPPEAYERLYDDPTDKEEA